jgi:hypothetical protein
MLSLLPLSSLLSPLSSLFSSLFLVFRSCRTGTFCRTEAMDRCNKRRQALLQRRHALQQRHQALLQRRHALQQRHQALRQRRHALQQRRQTLQQRRQALHSALHRGYTTGYGGPGYLQVLEISWRYRLDILEISISRYLQVLEISMRPEAPHRGAHSRLYSAVPKTRLYRFYSGLLQQ